MVLQVPPGSFRVLFEVERGWKAYSDYGIDDVRLENGTCGNLRMHEGIRYHVDFFFDPIQTEVIKHNVHNS